MPFALLVVGLLMIVVAIRNTQAQLGAQIVQDFTGPGNFFYWIAALFIVGALGYIDDLQKPSRALLALILLSLILSNRGFFAQFVAQLQQGSAQAPPPGPAPPQPSSGGQSGGSSQGASSGGGISAGTVIQAAATVASFL